MRLLKLSANMPSFHNIEFNKTGISLISANRRTPQEGKTYNSVGKSLSIYLIHFCLGANVTDSFKEKLSGWAFRLDFELSDGQHYSYRTTEDVKKIIFDGTEMSVNHFTKMMGKLVFNLEKEKKYLSFRALIARFIRMGKAGYIKFDVFRDKEGVPTDIINTSYLLGLDVNRLLRKVELKEKEDLLSDQARNLTKDPVLSEILLGIGDIEDIDLRLLDLDSQIKKLQSDIDCFVIAEDYGEIKKEADNISKQLTQWRNIATKCRIALDNVTKSLERRPDIKKQSLIRFFEEAKVTLGDMVVKQLEDVERFNERLLDDRAKVLSVQYASYNHQLEEATHQIVILEQQENEKIQYLNSHGVLDDYIKLTELLASYKAKKDKLEQFIKLQKGYKQHREELKKTFHEENIKTEQYLETISNLIKRHLTMFHDLVKEFYTDKVAGLRIENNENVNKQRFDIEARISGDSGDGVNETKIFCFDWTLLTAQCGHKIKFLVHDSRLISEVDPRQVSMMFRIADRLCREHGMQYILTINESSLELLRKEFSEEDYKNLVTKNEILKLDDASDSGKLLGIQVDLKYE